MAQFNATGLKELGLSFQQIAEIPDDVAYDMLMAASSVVVDAQKKSLRTLGLVNTGKLLNSIQAYKRRDYRRPKDDQRYVIVHPDGKRGQRKRRLVTKAYKRSKHDRTYTYGGNVVDVTNSEVAFIHEFGAPKKNIPASQWMTKANESCAAETVAAELAVYDRWLKSKNL